MADWGFWEWLAYVAMFVGATILAADTGIKSAPTLMGTLPNFTNSPWWGFAPLVAVFLATGILVGRNFGWLGRPQAPDVARLEQQTKIDGLEKELRLAREQVADLTSRLAPRFISYAQYQQILRGLSPPNGAHYIIDIQVASKCVDCANYSNDLTKIFSDAEGWTIQNSSSLAFSSAAIGVRGVNLFCKDSNNLPPEAITIVKAFKAGDIRVNVVKADATLQSCVLFVGPKEIS